MRAGNLRHLVSLQSAVKTQDGYGQKIETWSEYAQVYADIQPLQGRESYNAQQLNSEITVMVKMRYRSDVKAEHRIVYDGTTYEVSAPPINVGLRKRELNLLCKVVE